MKRFARLGVAAVVWVALIGAILTGAATASSAASPALTGSVHTSCEFATYQYVFIGVDGTYRDVPGGSVIGYLQTGDLLNSGFPPNSTGWISGNFYTSGGAYKGSGYALRQYFSYLRSWC